MCLWLLDEWDAEKGQTRGDYIRQVCRRSAEDFPPAHPDWLFKVMAGRARLWREQKEEKVVKRGVTE